MGYDKKLVDGIRVDEVKETDETVIEGCCGGGCCS